MKPGTPVGDRAGRALVTTPSQRESDGVIDASSWIYKRSQLSDLT
jgi:hypothetical protein